MNSMDGSSGAGEGDGDGIDCFWGEDSGVASKGVEIWVLSTYSKFDVPELGRVSKGGGGGIQDDGDSGV
jgi:hypothetical protein